MISGINYQVIWVYAHSVKHKQVASKGRLSCLDVKEINSLMKAIVTHHFLIWLWHFYTCMKKERKKKKAICIYAEKFEFRIINQAIYIKLDGSWQKEIPIQESS